jgi:sigma-B regulation protein RsbU (phosphoserine phosphatase)
MASKYEQIRPLLLDRREKLESIMESCPESLRFSELLSEVDSALERLEESRYGICAICGNTIEGSELLTNPLLIQCISHLPMDQQRKVYEDHGFAELLTAAPVPDDVKGAGISLTPWTSGSSKDLDLDINRARLVQGELLPESHLLHETWDICYEYIPSGALSGDYCDLVRLRDGEIFLLVGDAMGKGITACMIASRLHLLFRTLLDLKLPLRDMFERANRIFCECVLTSGQYATLICARATTAGTLELINAGHLPPLVLRDGGVERIMTSGLPLGLFFDSSYEVAHVQLKAGETLLCYTDGLTEARDSSENEYGFARLASIASGNNHLSPEGLVRVCREDVARYASDTVFSDDFTLLALRRVS